MLGFCILSLLFFIGIGVCVIFFRNTIFTTNTKYGIFSSLSTSPCIGGKRITYERCIPSIEGNGCLLNGEQTFGIHYTEEKCSTSSVKTPTSLSENSPTSLSEIPIPNVSREISSSPSEGGSIAGSDSSNVFFSSKKLKKTILKENGEETLIIFTRKNDEYEVITNNNSKIIIGVPPNSSEWKNINLIDGTKIEKFSSRHYEVTLPNKEKITKNNVKEYLDKTIVKTKGITHSSNSTQESTLLPTRSKRELLTDFIPLLTEEQGCSSSNLFEEGILKENSLSMRKCMRVNTLCGVLNCIGEGGNKFSTLIGLNKIMFSNKGIKEKFFFDILSNEKSEVVIFHPSSRMFLNLETLTLQKERVINESEILFNGGGDKTKARYFITED